MAKLESKRLNIRIRRDVAWQLEALAEKEGISQTEVIERAILAAGGLARVTPVAPVVEVRPEPQEEFPFHPRCLHCGEVFGSRIRSATTCGECKRSHHAGEPRNCDVCTAGQAL